MAVSTDAKTYSPDQVLVITRVFDAPPSLVFKAWTSPEHLAKWWGPKDFKATSVTMDFRTGGAYRACIRSPEGTDYWMAGVYREIDEPDRLVFTFAWEEPKEKVGPETLVTVTFDAQPGNRTKMTFRHAPFATVEDRDSHNTGWSECFDRLAVYVTMQKEQR